MEELYIPTLHTFAMNNSFTGSLGSFRFRIVPNVVMATPKEVDFENSSIQAEYWHGIFCYEKSQIEGKETFPMSDMGRQSLLTWLKAHI
ncbi:MAG: hypothetical protein IKC95_06490 [Oscillospiraceae bacterium]|nr:hypothetical protein [Oscillospiraceae bacterium]